MTAVPRDVATTAPAFSGYSFAGTTQHFRVYYSNSFQARAMALNWVNVVERDFGVVNTWFREVDYLSAPVNLFLDPAGSDVSYGYGGAYWLPGKGFETHVKVALTADFGWLRSGFMAEVSEQFMKLQDRGWFHPDVGLEGTNGESLSLVCARELEKAIGANDVVLEHRWYEPLWLNSARADWVNTDLNDYSKTGGNEAVGCGLLFIYYLMNELGYSLQDVIVAAAPTLRQVYRNLTNDPNDPFPPFKALLDAKYPPGTKVPDRLPDDGFPINPAPTRFPGNEYIPVPDATVNGYIDGLTINGATSQYTSATEFSQYATGDVVIPPVTSGSPIAAIDLCWQLAGNNRLTYFIPRDAQAAYWSLQGHEAGFNPVNQKAISSRDESVYRLFHEKVTNGVPQGTVYRCWRVRDSYNAHGWASYSDGIYSTGGQGSSVSVKGGTRTHLAMTTRPGDSPVQVTFGTDFSHLGFGPNGEKEGFGKYFNISLDNTSLKITAGYRKTGGTPVEGVTATTSTLPLNVSQGVVVQLLIGLEWTDASTFTVQATAALPDFTLVTTSLVMSSTGIDPFSAPWTHTGAIRGLFVQTVQVADDGLNSLVGPYEAAIPLRSTLQDWGVQPPGSLILGMTGSVWDYLTQVAVARQVDIRNVDGTIVVTEMRDVTFMSYLWDPVQSPSVSFGLDNTSKFIEVVRNRVDWQPNGVTVYDSRKTGESYTVTPGTTTTFNVTAPAGVALFYTPAPVGGPSSLTEADIQTVHAGTDQKAMDAVYAKAYADALRDYQDFVSPTAHIYGAYCISGTFGDFPNHSMPAAEWVAFGGTVLIIPTDTPGSVTVSVTAPVIPGWTGDYLLGLHGNQDYPMVRLVGTGVTSSEETVRFATGANRKFTTTEVGSTLTNVAATSLAAVNNLATRAVNDASGPSMQLSASVSMAEVRGWGASIGSLPGSTLLYRNMQWRILSATISNASVDITAAPYTTYTSAYWAYNWGDLTMNDFQFYWNESRWDDYKVAPLNGAIAEWSNNGATVKHTLFPTPDPNDPSVPLMPSDSLMPGRFVLPYAGADPNVPAFPSDTLFPGA